MSTARTETAEQRSVIYGALVQRNRLVGLLRIGLPAIGAIVFCGLLLQLYVGSLVPDFGFANISFDRDNLVVEAPSYAGVGADGTAYRVEAEAARAAFGNTDLIHMTGARFSMTQPEGSSFVADAETASLLVSDQLVTVTGTTRISGDSGVTGTLADAEIDVDEQQLRSAGEADLTFSNGATLEADSMTYEGASRRWQFTGVTLNFPSTPGEDTYRLRPGAGLASEQTVP